MTEHPKRHLWYNVLGLALSSLVLAKGVETHNALILLAALPWTMGFMAMIIVITLKGNSHD